LRNLIKKKTQLFSFCCKPGPSFEEIGISFCSTTTSPAHLGCLGSPRKRKKQGPDAGLPKTTGPNLPIPHSTLALLRLAILSCFPDGYSYQSPPPNFVFLLSPLPLPKSFWKPFPIDFQGTNFQLGRAPAAKEKFLPTKFCPVFVRGMLFCSPVFIATGVGWIFRHFAHLLGVREAK